MFGKFDRKTVERAFVESCYESFDDLLGEEIERLIFLYFSKHAAKQLKSRVLETATRADREERLPAQDSDTRPQYFFRAVR